MNNDRAKADMAELLDTVDTHIRAIAQAHRRRTELTATAATEDGRVRATVNADGVLIETVFSDDIDDLDYDEIAVAVTAAAQGAAEEVARKAAKLFEPIQATRKGLPNLSDLVPDLPDLHAKVPEPQRASFDPPADRKRDAGDGPRRSVLSDEE